jgi:hypothetical protein
MVAVCSLRYSDNVPEDIHWETRANKGDPTCAVPNSGTIFRCFSLSHTVSSRNAACIARVRRSEIEQSSYKANLNKLVHISSRIDLKHLHCDLWFWLYVRVMRFVGRTDLRFAYTGPNGTSINFAKGSSCDRRSELVRNLRREVAGCISMMKESSEGLT